MILNPVIEQGKPRHWSAFKASINNNQVAS